MNTSKLLVVTTIAVGTLAGCQSLPQAGLIYSSTINAGVGLKISAADAVAPVDISIGFKTADVAYVPVAVTEERKDGRSSVEKIWATHSNSNGQVTECIDAKAKLLPAGKKFAELPAVDKEALESACDYKRDALSVYGQFNGNGTASGSDKSAGLLVGRVFATGVAAQNVSHAAGAVAIAECVKAVSAIEKDPAKQVALAEKLCQRGAKG